MKKAAVVWSSPNTDGLTASSKDQFVKGLQNAGAQVEEIHLNKKKLEHCRACGNGWGTCSKKGACVIQDDFAEIYQTLKEADGIVWISAVLGVHATEEDLKIMAHKCAVGVNGAKGSAKLLREEDMLAIFQASM